MKRSFRGGLPCKPLALLTAAAALPLVLLLAGCGGGESAKMDFPEFVFRSEQSLEGYRIADAHPELLEVLPCYCGCGQDAEKYQNLKDCFLDRKLGGYDEHAAGCTTCLEEARDAGQWLAEGKSVKEIREAIDAKYAERGEPTGTPMP